MCYDIKAKLEAMLKRARYRNDEARIADLLKELEPYVQEDIFHASGFAHPSMLIYPNKQPDLPIVATWGLVPSWVKGKEQLEKMWNRTLNARGETMFDKSSFRHSARQKRCLIYVDAFFEHHHYNDKTYPFLVKRKDDEPICLAGLWSEWIDKETGEVLTTFSIVTGEANSTMAKIHNNPKLPSPRMPVILSEDFADDWLMPCITEYDKAKIEHMVMPYPDEELETYTVNRLRGKEALGNVPEASEKYTYSELPKDILS